MAYDVNGNNDVVITDAVNLGNLNMGNNVVSTTVFSGISLIRP